MDKIKTSFLLGAGTSRAVGKPSTEAITSEILSESGRQSTKFYEIFENSNEIIETQFDKEILEYLIRLNKFAEHFNTNEYWNNSERILRHKVNYEDISYLLTQIYEHVTEDFNILGALLICLTGFDEVVDKWQYEFGPKNRKFVAKALSYIYFTVKRMLEGDSEKLDKIRFIDDVCRSEYFQLENIFTLNHDKVLERLLESSKLNYIDGFGHKDGDIRKWNPKTYDNVAENGMRLMKLHGSIDWKTLASSNKDQSYNTEKTILGIYVGLQDIDSPDTKIIDSSGNVYEPLDSSGNEMLIGTENKLGAYFHLQYRELHDRFRKYLKKTDLLIVCGYSFGDHEINGQVLEWVQNEPNKRMIIIDTKEELTFIEELEYQYRRQIPTELGWCWIFRYLQKTKKAFYLQRKIEEMKISDIEPLLQ